MGQTTEISWCDSTFNPWIGCTKVSEGCKNCYAETLMDHRYGRVKWGKGNPRQRTSAANWKLPLRWNKQASIAGKTLTPDQIIAWPRPRVFTASLADIFDEEVDDDWRYDLFGLIANCPNLDFLVLTKRIGRAAKFFDNITDLAMCDGAYQTLYHSLTGCFPSRCSKWFEDHCPPPNIWLGTSVENQAMADKRIPLLCAIPAKVRFLSVEPMLEKIDLQYAMFDGSESFNAALDGPKSHGIHWGIFGGESGKGARPCNIEWIRDGVEQCRKLGIAPFVKQLGSDARSNNKGKYIDEHGGEVEIKNAPCYLKDKKGGDPSEWPEDLRVREFPEVLL